MRTNHHARLPWLLLLPVIVSGCGGSSSDLQSPSQPDQPRSGSQSDLSPSALDIPSEVHIDSLLAMRVGVRNGGLSTAGPGWFIRVFLSSDPVITPDDILIDQFVTSRELPPGTDDRYVRNMKLPGRLDPGRYHVGSILDVTEVVPETNEDNNTLLNPPTITVMPKAPPGTGDR